MARGSSKAARRKARKAKVTREDIPPGFFPGLLGGLSTPADVFEDLLGPYPSAEAIDLARRMGVIGND